MKKTLLLAGVASLFAMNVNAVEFKPYVGLDYVYSDATTNDVVVEEILVQKDLYENKFNSFSINVGAKINDNFGVEAFYQKSSDAKGDAVYYLDGSSNVYTDKIETSFDAYGIDAMGYLPFNEKVDGIGSIGLGQYDFEMSGFGTSASEDGLGVRLGAGVQYNVNEHFAIRGLARYVVLDMDAVDDMTEFSIGARYTF